MMTIAAILIGLAQQLQQQVSREDPFERAQ